MCQRSWDHPRACGEHRRPDIGRYRRAGIIPALAGNTSTEWPSDAAVWDHPRACGEHAGAILAASPWIGSSPRLRGTHHREPRRHHGSGIIPALAGNTGSRLAKKYPAWDHPRACGEHAAAAPIVAPVLGSSPRLRGTQDVGHGDVDFLGIIPALAGNTDSTRHPSKRCWDHPRACGEHERCAVTVAAGAGSSPRLRGTPEHYAVGSHSEGIIPALAGNTLQSRRTRFSPRDHPRACGEHGWSRKYCTTPMGSSPRLRGTLRACGDASAGHRIIPALAGNTRWKRPSAHSRWDHPRACGEHGRGCGCDVAVAGSSPRLRGTHTHER